MLILRNCRNAGKGDNVKRIERITIIGMGALGVMYGTVFAENMGSEAVTFLADKKRILRYRKEGVFCNGKRCDFRFQEAAERAQAAELLIFAVKATALAEAVAMAKPYIGSDTVILSVLNGISSEEVIGAALGTVHVLYCVAQGMDAVKIGNELTYANLGTLCIGIPETEPEKEGKLKQVEELFKRAGLPYVRESDIRHRIWSKWMLNVGVNQVVMVTKGTYRTIQEEGQPRALMIAAMEEVMALAEKAGIPVTRDDLDGYVALVDTLNPDGMPSMRQDGLAGRYSEVELFAGTVIRKAQEYQLEVPVNRELYRIIQEMEAGIS